jgi:dihydrofolate synthase/folylpolyglutamate synthase
MAIQNYKDIETYLFNSRVKGMKFSLEPIQALMDRLNHPYRAFPSIHIAGTNGKGSTAAILESVLRAAGYQTGLYTSPHLVDMRERIIIRGKPISKKEVIETIRFLGSHIEATHVSFFEILTAMAFLYFAKNKIDIAVLETGLGGRLDATNVIHPVLTLLTEIGKDHTKILGKNLKSITEEKAGILKPDVLCISGTKRDMVKNTLIQIKKEKQVPFLFLENEVDVQNVRLTDDGSWFDYLSGPSVYKNLYLKLLGEHQISNAALALMAVDTLRKKGWTVSEEAIRKGLEAVVWPARLQMLQREPMLLLDSAHNPMGIKTLVKALTSIFKYHRLILVFGVLEDKEYRTMTRKIIPLADAVILTKPMSDRALDPEILSRLSVFNDKSVQVIPDIPAAWEKAIRMAQKDDLVCGCGSIFFVGEVLRFWRENKRSRLDDH